MWMSLICATRKPENGRGSLANSSRTVSTLHQSELMNGNATMCRLRIEYFICLRRHDEIVFVQAADLMRPPIDCHPAPLRNDQGMMIFFFRNGADLVRELQRLGKVFELE